MGYGVFLVQNPPIYQNITIQQLKLHQPLQSRPAPTKTFPQSAQADFVSNFLLQVAANFIRPSSRKRDWRLGIGYWGNLAGVVVVLNGCVVFWGAGVMAL